MAGFVCGFDQEWEPNPEYADDKLRFAIGMEDGIAANKEFNPTP